MTAYFEETQFRSDARNYVWDVDTLAWVAWDGASTGTSSGGTVDQGTAGASPWLVTGPLTDTQLRATAVPVSGTFWPVTQPVSGTFWQTTQPVSGTFWQTTQPVSVASLPLPSNAAAETGGNLALIKAKTDNLDAASSTLATASAQTTGNTSLGSIKTNTDPLVASGAGGYVRQDSTGTIAKESGGNLATLATNSALASTAALQTTGNASLTAIAGLAIAQAATITSQVGVLMQAAASDAASAYNVDTVVPLSLTTDGRLRVITLDESLNFTAWGDLFGYGRDGSGTEYGVSAW